MSSPIDLEKAKAALGEFAGQAEQLLKDPSQVEALLQKLEERMKEIPTVGGALSRLPLMISMIRGYITREYTAVSPKVVVSMLAAVIYLLKGKDLIPDRVPLLGYADDLAVLGAAFYLSEAELQAYARWRAEKGLDSAGEAEA